MADELLEQLEAVQRQRDMIAIVLLAVERAHEVVGLLASHHDDDEARAALCDLLEGTRSARVS